MLRWPNLLIVGLTQYLLYFSLLDPLYHATGVSPALTPLLFFLLVFATILVTLSGYIINDIFDYDIDQINKPDKVWIGKTMSKSGAVWFYWIINLVGFLVSVFVAYQIGHLYLSVLFPIASGILFLYSKRLKHLPLTGNIVVSLFCGFVALIVLYAEWDQFLSAFDIEKDLGLKVHHLFFAFAVFAFITTFIREIIKDIEDIEGDSAHGSKSFPAVFGTAKAKNIALSLTGILLILAALFFYWNFIFLEWLLVAYAGILILIPITSFTFPLYRAKEKADYSRLSTFIKIIMVLGLCYLIVFRFIYH